MAYLYLAIAIVFEVAGTVTLKATEGFSKIIPSLIVIFCYIVSIYLVSLTIKTIPVGIAYAIWTSTGLLFVVLISAVAYRQIPDTPAILGMTFIIMGGSIIQIYSKMINN